ncbi:MAG: tryptophan synthase subunit alpha [Rikenellaceae bacterium]
MNRIDSLLERTEGDILSVYYPAGYPNLDDTMPILTALEAHGVDMVELGIPFSDPMADGVVIQEAATRSLGNGMSLKKLFAQIESMRESISIPVILMGYLNPIMQYGFERFCIDCNRTGIDGVIIPDLPFKDYMEDYKEVAERHDIKVIMFITPETSPERIRFIDENASGFIYMVSSAATTGAQKSFAGAQSEYFARVDAMSLRQPRIIGFGVSNRETFRAACNNAKGAIVGSHFVKLLSTEPTIEAAITKLISDIKG